jgi:hypothetical protein
MVVPHNMSSRTEQSTFFMVASSLDDLWLRLTILSWLWSSVSSWEG